MRLGPADLEGISVWWWLYVAVRGCTWLYVAVRMCACARACAHGERAPGAQPRILARLLLGWERATTRTTRRTPLSCGRVLAASLATDLTSAPANVLSQRRRAVPGYMPPRVCACTCTPELSGMGRALGAGPRPWPASVKRRPKQIRLSSEEQEVHR